MSVNGISGVSVRLRLTKFGAPLTRTKTNNPTTKIWIYIDSHGAWRDFDISKPFFHITLRDVKKYLYEQRYFHKIKGGRHEFHVK